MFVMEKGLNMKWLGILFALATVISSFGSGNMPQSNNIAVGLEDTFGIEPWVSGLVLALLLASVILGGVKRIIKVAERVVPAMAMVYIIAGLLVIAANYENIAPSFASVLSDAFTGSAAVGGFLGASFAYAFNKGVGRGLYSNEAGQGSAPIAHAAAKTKDSASEGMVSLLEPFIDTILVCTMTALTILICLTPAELAQDNGILMTLKAFEKAFGNWGKLFLGVSVFFFSFSSSARATFRSDCIFL